MRIALLHHPRSYFPLDVRQMIGADVELIWAVDAAQGADPSDRLLRRLGPVVDLTGLDSAGAAAALGAERPDGIVTYVDGNLERAAAVARRLDLVFHTPEVARVLVDKRLQRRALAEGGVAGPAFWCFDRAMDGAEVRAQLAEVRLPAVVKPSEGSGSRGIVRVVDRESLAEAVTGRDVLVEDYLPDAPTPAPHVASYLSVESVVSGGRARHVAFCGRFPLAEPFRETGNIVPGPVAPALQAPVLELADRAVAALGIVSAVIHTEIKLTPDGPRLVEVNGRMGGRPPFVLRDVSDVNLFDVSCALAAGRPAEVGELVPCDGVAFWRMVQPPVWAQRVTTLTGAEALLGHPEVTSVRVLRSPGDPVDWREGTDGCVAIVRGRTADHDGIGRAVELIDRVLEIGYDGEPSGGATADAQYRPVAVTARS